MVTLRENGTERRVTAAEAFMLQLAKRGLEGDNAAARALIRAIEDVRKNGIVREIESISICHQVVSPGSVNGALEILDMAELENEYSKENARIKLKGWIVEAALERLQGREVTTDHMKMVKNAM
jgi:hypothetical protein